MSFVIKIYLISMLCVTVANITQAQAQRAQTIARLMQAVRQGDMPRVASLIKQLPLNSRDERARTAVHYAVEHKQAEVLDALLYGGADPNIIDANGETPYDLWEQHKDEDIARILKREKAKSAAVIQQELLAQDRAIYTKRNSAMLFQAAAAGDREAVELLLEVGTDPKTRNSDGFFPFHVAVQNKRPAVASILLRAISDIDGSDDKSWTPLHWAVLAKDWEMVRGLLRENAKFRYRIIGFNRTYQDPYDVAKLAKVDDQFLSLVFAEQRHDIVKTLGEKATRDEDIDLIEQLDQHGLDLTEDKDISSAMLYQAVRSNKLLMVEFLLEYGVHEESKRGLLAKRFAIYQERTLELLLEYIKDRDEINQGFAAAYQVNRSSRKNSTKIFLEYGADPNALDSNDDTPIIAIVRKLVKQSWNLGNFDGHLEDIRELLEHGADIDATDVSGKTALMLLASADTVVKRYHDYLTLMKLLLEHGADRNITDIYNLTARDYAARKFPPNKKTLKLLE